MARGRYFDTRSDFIDLRNSNGVCTVGKDGRLHRISQARALSTLSRYGLSDWGIRVDGMYVRKYGNSGNKDVRGILVDLIDGVRNPERDYDIVLSRSSNGGRVFDIISRSADGVDAAARSVTSVVDLFGPRASDGSSSFVSEGFYVRDGNTVVSDSYIESVGDWCAKLCEVHSAEASDMANASGYTAVCERIAFANRINEAAFGRPTPFRTYDNVFLAKAFGIDETLVGMARAPVDGISSKLRDKAVDLGKTCALVDVAQVISAVGGRIKGLRYGHKGCVLDIGAAKSTQVFDACMLLGCDRDTLARSIFGPNPSGYVQRHLESNFGFTMQPELTEPEPAVESVEVIKRIPATDERVASVSRWMDMLGDNGSRKSDWFVALRGFVDKGTALAEATISDAEKGFGIPEGALFCANDEVQYVHTDKVLRELGSTETLADTFEHMWYGNFSCDGYDSERHSVAFSRADAFDAKTVSDFVLASVSGDIERQIADSVLSVTIANGANVDVEERLHEMCGVVMNGGIAEESAASIMDAALGLRTPPNGHTAGDCLGLLSEVVRSMAEDATPYEAEAAVKELFAKRGHLIDLSDVSQTTLDKMRATDAGPIGHLPWSERDDDGTWHSIVCVNDVYFVEDERGIRALPRYDNCDVNGARNILAACMGGIGADDGLDSLPNLADETPESTNDEKALTNTVEVDDTLAKVNSARGRTEPTSHFRRGFLGLRACGPGHCDYRISYVSACTVGADAVRCDLTRVHRANESGILSGKTLGQELVDKLVLGREKMFESHNRYAATHPEVQPYASIDDVRIEIHVDDLHLMDGVDTKGVKYRIVTSDGDTLDGGGFTPAD